MQRLITEVLTINADKKARLAAGLSSNKVVAILKPEFPKVSKAAVSLAERTDLTGVTFCAKARRIMQERTESRRSENRACPCRWAFRTTQELSAVLNSLKQAEGFETTNAFLLHIVLWYIETHKKGRAATGETVDSSTTNTTTSYTTPEVLSNERL